MILYSEIGIIKIIKNTVIYNNYIYKISKDYYYKQSLFGVDSIWLLSCGLFPGECLATGVVCTSSILVISLYVYMTCLYCTILLAPRTYMEVFKVLEYSSKEILYFAKAKARASFSSSSSGIVFFSKFHI